ncbi:MAG: hypothetical protein AAGA11_03210 [Pseudomonadota bacterium]
MSTSDEINLTRIEPDGRRQSETVWGGMNLMDAAVQAVVDGDRGGCLSCQITMSTVLDGLEMCVPPVD